MHTFNRLTIKIFLLTTLAAAFFTTFALAQEQAPPEEIDSRKVDINSIKEKYWAKGNEAELRVVQNRTYSKAGKLQLGLFGSAVSTDPFLSVKALGGSIGFHLSEYLAIRFLGFRDFVSASSALRTFEDTQKTTTNSNYPKAFLGAELAWSPIYGKLSLWGQSIIYFDFHVAGGGGVRLTESGNYPAPMVGVGQQIHLSKRLSLSIDYRLIYFREDVEEKVIQSRLGQVIGRRNNYTDVFMLGVTFLLL